jgi:hypothetical protein
MCCLTDAPPVRMSYGALGSLWLEGTRVLFAMQEDHRVYREVMAGSLRAMRPCLEVATADPTEFEERLESFKPQVVICGGRSFARREWPVAWVDLAFDSVASLQRPARIWVDSRCREMLNPGFEDLVSLIDEVDLLWRTET